MSALTEAEYRTLVAGLAAFQGAIGTLILFLMRDDLARQCPS